MSAFTAAVWMVVAAMVGTAALAGLWTVLIRVGESGSGQSERVLPSHYASLLHTSPSKYPGYCADCGTNNDPAHDVCRECSARLPSRRRERTTDDPERIFGS